MRRAMLALALVAAAAARASAQTDDVRNLVEKHYPSLESFYTTLHKEPELSLAEAKTAKRLAEELRKAGYEVTEGVGGHGVVAVLKNGPGRTLLVRADLDALPVKEQTGAPYASTARGTTRDGQSVDVMHACGHDVHVTCLIGAARALAELKDRWKGTLVLIGQPAEEIGMGAMAMLADGLFKKFPRPDWCLALHVDAELEAGKVGYVSGYALANVDSVDLVIRGVGGHGAHPDKTRDPVVIAAQTILALQTIDSRETDPLQPVVVTVGSIHGGTKHNIIPDQVVLQLTVRSYTDEVRDKTLKAIERIAKGIAQAAGVPEDRMPTVTLKDEFTPATYNTPELVERVTEVFQRTVGEQNVVKREPSMGGEDFSRYGRAEPKVPIFMYRLGAVPPQRVSESKQPGGKPLPSLHSPFFLPEPKATIRTGVVTMTAAALDLLKPQ
ncbi:MAG TPA: amidohydrolase [Tepidisphaeraceae bacterium]|nr:amidohydrolase [Tepidisphaeraceae bacterium]